MDNPPKCPECGRTLLRNGVMLYGNVFTNEPQRPVVRWECPNCLILVAGDIDAEEGWRQWDAQGNKRPDTQASAAPPARQEYKTVLAFELCDEGTGLLSFSRPQDYRVKAMRWQYLAHDVDHVARDGTPYLYHVYAYARRWLGEGKDPDELDHNEHPTAEDIQRLIAETLQHMGGLPIGDQAIPMAWDDPIMEDDFLDETDDPDALSYWDDDDDLDFDY